MTLSTEAKGNKAQALDEASLIERAEGGDPAAFRAIMERHNRRLYRLARVVMKDDAAAEDVVQETYLRAFSSLAGFRGEASLATWLTRIALNEALGRKHRRRPALSLEALETMQQASAQIIRFPNSGAESDPERVAASREIRRLLEGALDALPEAFRLAFVLRDVEGLTTEEAAEHLGIRPETVKTRLHRARRLLRRSLAGQLRTSLTGTFPFAGARCARLTAAVLDRLAERNRAD